MEGKEENLTSSMFWVCFLFGSLFFVLIFVIWVTKINRKYSGSLNKNKGYVPQEAF